MLYAWHWSYAKGMEGMQARVIFKSYFQLSLSLFSHIHAFPESASTFVYECEYVQIFFWHGAETPDLDKYRHEVT